MWNIKSRCYNGEVYCAEQEEVDNQVRCLIRRFSIVHGSILVFHFVCLKIFYECSGEEQYTISS